MAQSAGIVVYNADNQTVLIGTGNSGYEVIGYGRPTRTIQEFFMRFVQNNTLAIALPPVLPDGHAPGTNLRTVPGGAWNYVQQLFPEHQINIAGAPERHLVDTGVGAYLTRASFVNSTGYPKGGRIGADGGDLRQTALREFQEETGFNFRPLLGGGLVMHNVGVHNDYQYYFIVVDNAIAQDILNAYGAPGAPGRRFNSELFNLRFVNTNAGLNLDQSSRTVTTALVVGGRLPGRIGGVGFAGGSYYNKYQKYQNKLLSN
jgi:hypothetical protein